MNDRSNVAMFAWQQMQPQHLDHVPTIPRESKMIKLEQATCLHGMIVRQLRLVEVVTTTLVCVIQDNIVHVEVQF